MQETWVQSLSCEDPLEKEMATHSSIFAWNIPWTAKPGVLQSMGSQGVRHDRASEQQQPLKRNEINIAIYSNIDGSQDYHTKDLSDRQRQILYSISYM